MTTGIAFLALATVVSAQGYTFNTNLTVGSTGADVVALQTWLIANGFNIPSIASGAAAKGYFGTQTKTAVMQFQTSKSLPSTGFVGPLTRGVLNAGGSMTGGTSSATCPAGYTCTVTTPVTTATCPTGFTCTANPGTTGTITGGPTGITTPGVQGIMSVTQGPISNSVAYVGSSKVPLLDARIQAQYSDISVQTIQLDLGSSTNVYNFIYSKLYVIDPTTGNVLTSVPLNSSTVVQNGNNYVVGLSGLNFIIPKGTYKDLQIAGDLYNQINNNNLTTWYINLDQNSIRGVDGAGVNLYGPLGGTGVNALAGFSSGFGQGMVINQSLVLNATANISLDSTSPLANSYGVQNTSTGQYLALPVSIFDVNAQGDTLHLHNVTVNFVASGQGSITAAYLYNGSTAILSSAITSNGGNSYTATFSNIPDGTTAAVIPVNQTVPFTVKVDVTGLTAANSAETITASTSGMTIYNSMDSNITVNGSASGNTAVVQGQGAVFALSGTPTITKTITSTDTNGNSTTTYVANFNVTAQAVGTSITFGLPSSTGFVSFGSTTTGYNLAALYMNGAPISATNALPNGNTQVGAAQGSLVAGYSQPTNTTLSSNGFNFTLGINQSVTIPVTYSFSIRNANANTFAVQLQGIATSAGTSTFMANLPTWRTTSI